MKNSTRRPHLVTFTSSSTARNFYELLGPAGTGSLRDVQLASIGPVTSATLRELQLPVAIEAREYTMSGLIRAILLARYATLSPEIYSRGIIPPVSDLQLSAGQRRPDRLADVLSLDRHSRKFNAIAYAWVAGSDYGRDGDALIVQIEIDTQHGSYGEGQHALHVAAIATHIGGADAHRRLNTLVAQFNGK